MSTKVEQSVPVTPAETPNAGLGPDLIRKIQSGSAHEIFELPPGTQLRVLEEACIFPEDPQHSQRLRDHIRVNGQLTPGWVIVEDGEVKIAAGRSRSKFTTEFNRPFLCRHLTPEALGGRSLRQFLIEENFGPGGRPMGENERAFTTARMFRDQIRAEAKKRKENGKEVKPKDKGATHVKLAAMARVNPSRMWQAIKVIESGVRELEQAALRGVPISVAANAAKYYFRQGNEAKRQAVREAAANEDPGQATHALKSVVKGVVCDALEFEVPPWLQPVWRANEELSKRARSLTMLAESLVRLQADFPEGTAGVNFQQLRDAAEILGRNRKLYVCESCDGHSANGDDRPCGSCEGRGYKVRRPNVPARVRAH